jgi:peptidyl-prolyl cis-trans isomerase B (cyclophilin B)
MECPSLARADRTLGNTSLICSDGENLGRIVIGLYGKQVPQTVKNFKAMCTGEAGSSFEGTIFNRVLQGQYISGGRQGPRDKGETSPPTNLDRNDEVVRGNSFKLRHQRPGTVSLCLSENDDEEAIKLNPDYRNVEFMITTGPGPAPQLDNGNIVFGTVLEGMDVVAAVSTVPTYKPSGRIQQFNSFAQLLGDDRAASARANWDKPLKSVVIKKCGLWNAARPHLAPSLP